MLTRLGELEHWFRSREEPVLLIDAGGVLFDNVIENSTFIADAARLLGVGSAELLAEYTSHETEFESNRAGVYQLLANWVQRIRGHDLDMAVRARIDELYLAATVPNTAMFSALRAVRDVGKTLVLANNEAEHWDRIKDRIFGHFDLFDFHGSSWRLGVPKPSPEYFTQLDLLLSPLSRWQWHLLDDNPGVVARAREEGIAATQYAAGVSNSSEKTMR